MKNLLQQHLIESRPGAILQTLLKRQRLPQALILTGPEGVGQAEAAEAFAMACNCFETARRAEPKSLTLLTTLWGCGQCRSCLKIQSDSHPDILRITPIGQTLRIKQIRAMLDNVALKPYEARRRFVLIAEADRMTPSAANAILKVLEEPPHETSIVMWSYRPRDMLPTIVSRCQMVRFPPLSESQLVEMFIKEGAADIEAARWAARLSGGSYTISRNLLAKGGFDQQGWIENVMTHISACSLRRVMALAELMAADRAAVDMRLSQIKHYWHTRAMTDMKGVSQNGPAAATLSADRINSQAAIACFFTTQNAEQKLQTNANRRMVLETMLMTFRQHLQTKTNEAVADG